MRNDDCQRVSDTNRFTGYLDIAFDQPADAPSIDVRRDVEQMLSRFVDAAMDTDPEMVAEFYSFPVGFVRPTGFMLLHSVEEFCAQTKPALAAYLEQGVRAITYDLLQLSSYTPVMARAEVRWDHLDGAGSVVRSLYSTLVLRWQGDMFRVVLHMSHNEILERPTRATA